VVGTEHPSVAPLELLESIKGFSEFFIWRRHEASRLSSPITSILWRAAASILCWTITSQSRCANTSTWCFLSYNSFIPNRLLKTVCDSHKANMTFLLGPKAGL